MKMQDMKLQDTNLQDIKRKALNSTTWKCKTWIAGQKKEKVLTETTLQCRFLLLFLNTQQCDALGVNDYSSLRPSLCTRLIMDCAKWNQLPVTVTSLKTWRNTETDASSKSAMADEGETAVPASASSRILSRTRLPSCVTLKPRD